MSRYPRAARNAALKCIPCGAPLVETNDQQYVCVECGETPVKGRSERRTVLHVEKSVVKDDGGDVSLEYAFKPTTDEVTYFKAVDALPEEIPRGDLEIEGNSAAGDLQRSESTVEFSGILQVDPFEATVTVPDTSVEDAAFSAGPTIETVYTREGDLWEEGGPDDNGRGPVTAARDRTGVSRSVKSSESGPTSGPSAESTGPEFASAESVSSAEGAEAVRSNGTHPTDVDGARNSVERRRSSRAPSRGSADIGSPNVLVAIPAYNEADAVSDVVRRASAHAVEVLVVDDGSDDRTADRAAAAGADVVEHKTNRGYGAAIKTIFQEAYRRDADHLVIIDGDGQHDPADIPELVDAQRSTGAEVVIGSRFVDGGETDMPTYRQVGFSIINQLINLSFGVVRSESRVADTQSGFRAYDKRAIRSLAHVPRIGDGMEASIDILFHAHQQNYLIEEVPTSVSYDVADANNQNPLFHGYQLFKNVLRTFEHERPILFLGAPGFAFVLIGLAAAYLSFGEYLQTGSLSVQLAIPAVLFTLFGTFAAFTAIILHSLNTFQTAAMGRVETDILQRR